MIEYKKNGIPDLLGMIEIFLINLVSSQKHFQEYKSNLLVVPDL